MVGWKDGIGRLEEVSVGTTKGAKGSGEGILLDEGAGAGTGDVEGERPAGRDGGAGVREGVLSKYASISISSSSRVQVSLCGDLEGVSFCLWFGVDVSVH